MEIRLTVHNTAFSSRLTLDTRPSSKSIILNPESWQSVLEIQETIKLLVLHGLFGVGRFRQQSANNWRVP